MLKIFDTPYFKKRYNFEDRNAFLFCYLIILIPLLTFVIFFCYGNYEQIVQAFSVRQDQDTVVFGFGNFLDVFNEFGPDYKRGWNLWEVEWKSIQLYLIGWLFFFPGTISNYVLFKKCWGHYVFRSIFIIPGTLGGIVTVLIYKNMVNVNGPLFLFAESIFGELPPAAYLSGLMGTEETAWLTMLALKFIPGIVGFNLVQTGAYARIPTELFEVGRIDGLGFVGEFWTMAIPLTWSTMQIGFITGVAGMLLGDCGVFLYTKGAHNTATMGFYFYWQTYLISGQGDSSLAVDTAYGYPAALGLLFTAILVPMSLLTRKLCESVIEDVSY